MNSMCENGTFSKENVEIFEIEAYGAELRIYASVVSQKEQAVVNFVRSKLSSITILPLSPELVKLGDLILILTATGDLEHCICRALITDLNTSVKVLLVDEGQWNVAVPLEELYICPPHLHISIVPPRYEMFLLVDVPPHVSWNPQLIHNLKSKLQRKQIPAIINRGVRNNFICPLDKDSEQPLIMELFTAGGDARLLPILPEITQNFASLPQLPYRPWHNQNQLGGMCFPTYSNFCQISQLPIHSYGPSSNFFFPQISNTKGFNIPTTYFPQITERYPFEFQNSKLNIQANCNTTDLPKSKKKCYSAERLTAGLVMKGKISYIDEGPWKFFIQFDNQRRKLIELKEQLVKLKYKQHQGEIKQAFQLVVRVLGEYYRALALEDESHGKIEVLFVDTGHTDCVDTSDVFLLPESLNSFPFLVTRCKLSGLPKNYDEYASAKFAKLSLSSDNWIVEVVDPSNGIHCLTEVNISMKGHSILEMLIGYRNEVLVNGAKVFISHVCQEDEVIYIQDSKKIEQLESMQIVLQDHAKTAEFQDLESLNKQDVCIAMLPSNQNWYRAKILRTGLVTKVQGCLQQNIQVYFVDYGKCAWVSYKQIRQIEPALQELMPAQAIPTIFKDIDLTNLPSNQVIKLLKSRVWKVHIGVLLQKKLLYSSLKAIAQVEVSDAASGKNVAQVLDWKFPLLQMNDAGKSVNPLKQDDSEPPQIQLNTNSLKLCRITSAQTPKEFFVTLVENDTTAQELFCKLNNRCEESKFVLGKHGQIVAVKSSDQNWHRALVTRNYGECVELFLIDCGTKMKSSVSELRELPYEHYLWSFPAQAIKCTLDLEEAALGNPRFKESFCSQALGQLQNVHFKEKEHNTWKVEFVEKMDAPKVLVFMKEMAKSNISSTDSLTSAIACLSESTTTMSTMDKPQTLCSSKDNTTDRDKRQVLQQQFPQKKPILPKQHWKDMIINNLPVDVIAKHKQDINAIKKMSDASSDVYLSTKLSTCQAPEQIESYHSRNSSNIFRDVPAEIEMNKEKILNCSITNAKNDKGRVSSILRSQNTFSLGSMIKKSLKNEQDVSFRGSSVKVSTENDDKKFKMESCDQYAPETIYINQCDMHYLQQNIDLYKVIQVVVIWVESPIKYFCRLKDTNTEIFDVRMKEAQLEYDKLRAMEKTKIKSISKYPLRSSVMAYNDMKQTWYRGILLEYASSCEVKVQFVDYGNTEIIPLCDIYPMNEKFIACIPQQAIPIVVDDVYQAFLTQLDVQLLRIQLKNTAMECIFDRKLCSFEYHANSIKISGKDLKVYLSNAGIKSPTGLKEIKESSGIDSHYERYTHTNFSSASILAKKSGRERSIDDMRIKKDELPKGHPIQVYVSYVDKDKSFWVQQLDGVEKLNDMMENLQIKMSDNESKSKILTPTVNQYCTCKFSEDNTWYRGKIIEMSETLKVNIQYIDYGNSEVLEISDLYELPHEFTKLPEQAIHCCLPEFPNYNKEKMMILNSLIKENELLSILSYEVFDDMNILYEVSNKEVNEIPKSLVTFPQNTSVFGSDNIIGNTFNSATAPEISKAVFKINETVPLMAKAAPLACKTVVYITHTQADTGQVWLQRAEDTEILTNIEADIATSVTSMQVVDVPVVGSLVIGKSEDGIWYRAKVMDVFVESVLVYYLDYGNTEKIHNSQCITIPKQLEHQSALAYSCIINVEEKQYVEAMKILQQYLDQELIVNLHGENNDSYVISLLFGQENVLKDLQDISKKGDNDLHAKDTHIMSQKIVTSNSTHLQKKSCKMEKKNPLTISLCLVTVSHVETNGAIWIQCIDSSEALAVLMDSLHEYMNTTTAIILKELEVGEACVCQYSQDNFWYRGRVLNVNPTSITVLYSDYGNVEILEPCKVYNMPQIFLNLPEQAVRCDVPDYCNEISKYWLEKDCLASVSVYDNHTFISFLKIGEVQYIPQDAIKTIESDKLDQDSNSKENQSLFTLADESTWNKTLETNESTWNKTLQTNLEDAQIEANGKYCKQFLKKQDPINIKLNQVIISHFESDGSLWVRPIDSDSALVSLMDSIHEYTQTATLTSVNDPLEGAACLCCYFEDNEWYRARILKVTSNPPETTVLYVDYGNTQTLDSSKLFFLPKDFYSLPEQAIRCTIPDYCWKYAQQWIDQIGKVSVSLCDNIPHLSFLQIGEQVYIPINTDESKNIIVSSSDNESKHSESSIISEDVKCEKDKDLAIENYIVATNSSNTSTDGRFSDGKFVIKNLDENSLLNEYSKTNANNDATDKNRLNYSTVIKNLSQEILEPLVDESIWNKTEISLNTDKENNEINKTESRNLLKNDGASCSIDIFNVADQKSQINLESKENFIDKEDSQNSENIARVLSNTSLSPTISVKSLDDESLNDKSTKSVIFISNDNNSILECSEASEKSYSISEPCTLSDSIISKGISSNETNPFNSSYYSSEFPDSLADESLWNKTVSLNLVEREHMNTSVVKETSNCISASILFVDGNIVWIQLQEYSRLFDAFMDDLHAQMEESIPSHISHPSIGDSCVCQYTADNGWYRGRVVDVRNHDSVSVFYIDYGNSELQKPSNIYNLPQKFIGFPQQAIKCRLPDGSNELLSNFIGKKLKIKLTKVEEDFVIQYINFDNKEYILNKPNIAHSTTDSISSHLNTNTGDLIKLQDPTLINKSNVIITHVESNQSVWMQHTHSSESLDTLMNDLDAYMKQTTPLLLEKPFIGQPCVCKYSEDDGWYRARIFKITEGYTKITVLFIDYGNVEIVEHGNIFRIPVKFTILPEQSINCLFPAHFNSASESMINKECIVSVLETDGFPTISYFKIDGIEYISEHEILATKEENIATNKEKMLELSNTIDINKERFTETANKYTTSKNLQTEKDLDKTEEQTLNTITNIFLPIEHSNDNENEFFKRVQEMGFEDLCNSPLGNAQSEGRQSAGECFDIKSSEVSHLNDGKNGNLKVLDKTCEGSMMKTEKEIEHSSQIHSINIDNGESQNQFNNSSDIIKEIKALFYPMESILKLVHIFNETDNTIWVHLYENKTVLKEIMDCLNDYMQPLSSKDEYKIIPKVGDICIAKYPKNGLWFRSKILEHSDDLSTVKVHYIDFGYKETLEGCDFYDLPQETFAMLPHQAIHCNLELKHSEDHLNKIYNQDYFEGTFKSGHDLPILKIEEENFQQNEEKENKNVDNAPKENLDEGHQNNNSECKSFKTASETEVLDETEVLEAQNVYDHNVDLSSANIQDSVTNALQCDLSLADDVDQILDETLSINSPTSNSSLEKYENKSDSIEFNNEQVDSLLSESNTLDHLSQVEVLYSEPEFSCESNHFCSAEHKTPTKESPRLVGEHDYHEKMYSSSMMEGIPNTVDKDVTSVQQHEAFCALLVHIEESPFCLWIQEEENLDTVDFIDSSLEQIKRKEYVDDPEVNDIYAATLSNAPLRVVVKQVEKGEVFVHFIDQGKKSWVSTSRIFKIPTFLSEIKPLAKACYLPITIIPGRHSGAVLAMAETVLKKICVCVRIKEWKGEWGPGNLMLMTSPLIGSLCAFLADHDLAEEDDWKAHVGPDAANIIESNLNRAILKVTKSVGQEQNSSLLDNTLFVTADEDLAQKLKELSFVPQD